MKKVFILDTNVLIDNPDSLTVFRNGVENRVLVPYTVILELDRLKKRNDLTHIVSLISKNFEADPNFEVIKVPDKDYNKDAEDKDILEEVLYFNSIFKPENEEKLIVVSNDTLFRVRLKVEGIESQEFVGGKTFKSESQKYTGIVEEDDVNKPVNCFYWKDGKLYKKCLNNEDKLIDYENNIWNTKPKHWTQNAAMELILSDYIDIVSIQSDPGYGKSHLALAGALHLVLQKPKKYKKIYIIKPIVDIGNSIGFLPGNIDEKLAPYMRGVMDLIFKLHSLRPANALFVDSKEHNLELNINIIEILHLGYLRGLNLDDCVVILEEFQNSSRYEARSILSRMGNNVKCIITGSINQIDNPHLNSQNNGLNWLVKLFKNLPNYGHIVLHGSQSRGPICDAVIKSGL